MSADSVSSVFIERMVREACEELETRLRQGESQVIEKLLADLPELSGSADNALELIYHEITIREELGDRPQPQELFERFPIWRDRIARLLEVHEAVAAEELAVIRSGSTDTSRLFERTMPAEGKPLPSVGPQRRIGPYTLLEEIGRGGTGVVYRAHQVTLDRLVALKCLHVDIAGRDQVLRFQAEAEAAARLQHPNIVQIYEVGEENGFSYISLELVDGGNLSARLADSPMEPVGAASLVAKIAEAMEYAHSHGIVHRDLKPANILLAANGEPKIADFGLAKRSWEQERMKTRDGAILGTPGYMAPEQAVGHNDQVGPLADVYALGAILYELMTGHAPFHAGSLLETLEQVRFLDPVPPRHIRPRLPRDLETICLKCLRKQPESRYASASELAEDLRRFLNHEPIRARQVSVAERCVKWVKRRPAVAALTAAIAAVALVGFIGVFWQWSQSERRRSELEKALIEIKAVRTAENAQRERLNTTVYLQRVAASYGEWLANHPDRADQLLEQCEPQLRGWEWRYLDRLMHAERQVLEGHELPVEGLVFSPDGRKLASCSSAWGYNDQGQIIIWDTTTMERCHVLTGHESAITDVAFNPDGTRLASVGGRWTGTNRGQLIIWDVATGQQVATCKSRYGVMMDVEFSRDGKLIAVASVNGQVELFHADSLKEYKILQGHTQAAFAIAFRPDGKMLASGSRDGTVRLWDVGTGQQIASLLPGADVRAVAFNPTGDRLAASTWTGIVKVWDVSPGSAEIAHELAHHQLRTDRVRALQFSPDGQTLAVGCSDGSMRIWQPITGLEIRQFRAHSGNVLSLAFHPGGHRIASGGGDSKVKCWNLVDDLTLAGLRVHSTQIVALSHSPDGKRIALAGGENHAMIGSGQKTVTVWDVAENRMVLELRGHTGWLTSVAYSPRGDLIVSSSEDETAIVWDAQSGKPAHILKGHRGVVTSAVFAEEGEKVVTAGADKTIRIWDVGTGREEATLTGHEAAVTALSMNSLNGELVSAGEDNTVRIWDLSAKRPIAVLHGHTDKVTDVLVSPRGDLIASCGEDAQLIVWHRAESENKWAAKYLLNSIDREKIIRLAFHPNGNRLAGIRNDASVTLWDMASGQEAFSQRTGHESLMGGDVEFSPDEKRLVVTYSNHLVIRDANSETSFQVNEDASADWRLRQIASCESDRNWRGARFHYDHLIAAFPENWSYHFRRGHTHASQGDWQAANEDHAAGLSKLPPDDKLTRDHVLELTWYLRRHAEVQFSAGRTEEAIATLRTAAEFADRALKKWPDDHLVKREGIRIARHTAQTYKRVKPAQCKTAYQVAVTLGEQLIKHPSSSLDDRATLANSMLNLAVFVPHAEAEPLYRRAHEMFAQLVKQNPKNANYRSGLALCIDDYGLWLIRDGRIAEGEVLNRQALALRRELLEEKPHDLEMLRLLARSYDQISYPDSELGNDEQARQFWQQYFATMHRSLKELPIERVSGEDANSLSWYLTTCPFPELRDIPKAVEWGKVAVKLRPNQMGILNTLAVALYRNGDFKEAKELLLKSKEQRGGGDSYDWLFLAMCCWQLGEQEEARQWLEKSKEWTQKNRPRSGPLLRIHAEAEQMITPAEADKESASEASCR